MATFRITTWGAKPIKPSCKAGVYRLPIPQPCRVEELDELGNVMYGGNPMKRYIRVNPEVDATVILQRVPTSNPTPSASPQSS